MRTNSNKITNSIQKENDYCIIFTLFSSTLFNNWNKTNSVNVSTPKVGVLNIEFALKLRI